MPFNRLSRQRSLDCLLYWVSHSRMCANPLWGVRRICLGIRSTRHDWIRTLTRYGDGSSVRVSRERLWSAGISYCCRVDSIISVSDLVIWIYLSCHRLSPRGGGCACWCFLLRPLAELFSGWEERSCSWPGQSRGARWGTARMGPREGVCASEASWLIPWLKSVRFCRWWYATV